MLSSGIEKFHIQCIKKSLILFLSLFSLISVAQYPIEWEFTAGGSGDDSGRKLLLTDGGVIVIGTSSSSDFDMIENQGGKDAVIFKMDQEGNTLWQHTYGGSDNDVIYDIEETPDQGFIAVGYSSSNNGDLAENNGMKDYWIFKVDSQGALQWTKTYGGANDDVACSVYVTQDEGFVVAGDSRSGDGDVSANYGNKDCWVIRLDSSGNLIWEKNYGGSQHDKTTSIIQIADEGYILLSGTESEDFDVSENYSFEGEDIWVVRIDNDGIIVWEKNFGGSSEDSPEDMLKIDDQNYLICGRTSSLNYDIDDPNGSNDGWVFQINDEAGLVWSNSLGGTDWDRVVSITHAAEDDGFIFAGYSRSSDGDVGENYGEYDVWVGKLSNNGELVWEQNYGGTGYDSAESIVQSEDGHLLFTGVTSSSNIDIEQNNGSDDFWVVCLESTIVGLDGLDELLDLNFFPNPAHDQITIFLSESKAIVQCDIVNASGQIVRKVQLTRQNTVLDISDLAPGIYSLRVLSGTSASVHKIVVY
jgi:hypothetical protein